MDASKNPEGGEIKLHFLDYWRIIRIRKLVIFIVFILVVMTSIAATLLMKPVYASMVRISVDKDKTDIRGLDGSDQGRMTGYDPFFLQTQFEIITSQSILDQVIEDLNLVEEWQKKYGAGEPLTIDQVRKILSSSLDVRLSRNTSLIEIWARSDSIEESMRIADKVAEIYRDSRIRDSKQTRRQGVVELRKRLDQLEAELSKVHSDLDRIRSTNDISLIDEGGMQGIQLVQAAALREIQSQKLMVEAEYVRARTQLDEVVKRSLPELRDSLYSVVPDPTLQKLTESFVDNTLALTKLRQELGPEHPTVKAWLDLIERNTLELDNRIKGIMDGMEINVRSLSNRLAKVDEILKQSEQKMKDQTTLSLPYMVKKKEEDKLEKLIAALELRVEQENLDAQLSMESMVKVIDKASKPLKPVRPNITLNVTLGVVVGLVLGVGLAFFIEYLDTSVKTIDDVERALQAPVLAVIPQNVGTLLFEGPESPHAEAYRVLRTNILFSRKDPTFNTMTVVSAGAGEGKSTTLFNLATTFAQNGARVLVVDSDLRRPSIHKIINVSNSLGLTNYLLNQNSLEEVIQRTSLASLDVLPSGKLPSSSMGILSSPQMKNLIGELKRRYDFVFFDSPPIMGISDAAILASEVDIVMQVIQYRRYPQPMTIRAKQMIQKVGGNLLGIVLNNINMASDENYYYYSGYYYDYYSKQDDDDDSGGKKESKKAGINRSGKPEIKSKY